MKTNEWLAYFVEDNSPELTSLLQHEAAKMGLQLETVSIEQALKAVTADFDIEAVTEGPAAFTALAPESSAELVKLWNVVEQKISDYVAAEEDMSGGARRLAYLRLSEYALQVRKIMQAGT